LIPRQFLAGNDQLAGAFRPQVVTLADRPLHQLRAAIDQVVRDVPRLPFTAGVVRQGRFDVVVDLAGWFK